MNRLARAAVLALVTAVALSGCIRYNVDMTLASDDTATGSVILAVQSGVGEQMGVASDDEALAQLFGESPFGPGFTESDYAEGDWVGKSYSFDALPIDELTDFSDLFTITREGDEFVVQGPDAPMTQDDLDQLPDGAESKLSITFPGEVTEQNGTLTGTTVTWDLFSATEAIHAKGKASAGSSGLPTALLIGGAIALVVLLGAALVVFMVVRKRGAVAPVTPTPLDAVDEPLAVDADVAPADDDALAPDDALALDAGTVPTSEDAPSRVDASGLEAEPVKATKPVKTTKPAAAAKPVKTTKPAKATPPAAGTPEEDSKS